MKNFYQCGDTVPLTMTAAVTSGQLIRIGAFVGVVANDAAAGASVETKLVGVFLLPKITADVIAQGQAVKFVPSTGIVSAAGTVAAGVATQAAAGSTQVYVRLTPGLGETVALDELHTRHAKPEHEHGDARHEHAKPEHAKHEHEHAGAAKH